MRSAAMARYKYSTCSSVGIRLLGHQFSQTSPQQPSSTQRLNITLNCVLPECILLNQKCCSLRDLDALVLTSTSMAFLPLDVFLVLLSDLMIFPLCGTLKPHLTYIAKHPFPDCGLLGHSAGRGGRWWAIVVVQLGESTSNTTKFIHILNLYGYWYF